VDDDAETGVEEQKSGRRQRVPLDGQVHSVDDVEHHRERQVGEHRATVGQRQTGQDVVRRRAHRRPRQHDDVGRIGHDADDADDDRHVPVELSVPEEELRRRLSHPSPSPKTWRRCQFKMADVSRFFSSDFFCARCRPNIYISRLCYDASVRMSVCDGSELAHYS